MRVIFPTDEHHPYVDHRALELALKICEDYNPDIRITGSDGVDFYSISQYDKNPARLKEGGMQEELDSWIYAQKMWLSAAPNASNYFIMGNHEDRLRRWMWKYPGLVGLRALTIPSLFEFEMLNIQMADNNGAELNLFDQLVISHGSLVRKYSAYTARGELEKQRYNISLMTGHTHRGGRFITRTRTGTVEALECFCLCDLDPEYVNYPDWQQGIVMADVTPNSKHFEMVPFYKEGEKLVARWRDKEYSA